MKPIKLNNPFANFVLYFAGGLLIFWLLSFLTQSPVNSFISSSANWLCAKTINSNHELKRVAGIMIKKEANGTTYLILGTSDVSKVNRKSKVDLKAKKVNFDTFAYLPVILLLSLIFASPVTVRRRIGASILGIVSMLVFIFFKLWILALVSNDNDIAKAKQLPVTIIALDNWLYNVLIGQTSLGAAMIIALVFWALFTFNPSDYEKLKSNIRS